MNPHSWFVTLRVDGGEWCFDGAGEVREKKSQGGGSSITVGLMGWRGGKNRQAVRHEVPYLGCYWSPVDGNWLAEVNRVIQWPKEEKAGAVDSEKKREGRWHGGGKLGACRHVWFLKYGGPKLHGLGGGQWSY